MSTINSAITNGVTIGQSGYTSPLTIGTQGTVSSSTGSPSIGVYAGTAYANPTIVNFGTVFNAVLGVALADGGDIVNTGTSALIRGSYSGVLINGAAGTVTNSGTIATASTASGAASRAVYLGAGGSVTNAATGLIQGYHAIYARQSNATITNLGTIAATGAHAAGIDLEAGGTITNSGTIKAAGTDGAGIYFGTGGNITSSSAITISGTGSIQGYRGIYVKSGGTIVNSGTIAGTGAQGVGAFFENGGNLDNTAGLITGARAGVYMTGAAGTVTNSGVILGTSGVGIILSTSGTVIDSGTIGGASTAISFAGTSGGNLLALEHGYSLQGSVNVAGGGNTLELLGSAGPVTIDFNKSAAGFANFGTVAFGAGYGNDETLTIGNTAALPGTIVSFTHTYDIIDLTQLNPTGAVANLDTSTDKLVVSNGSQSVSLQLDAAENYTGVVWTTGPDSGSGTEVFAACYCRGTRILTPGGEVPIEALAAGDLVLNLAGEARAIRWIGRRIYDGRFIAGNRQVLPIRIAAGALADGVPARDLSVSPGHSLYIDGALVIAEHVVNGVTIMQADAVDRVEYFHIELESHDILFAEGAPAESFVDCDNRLMFANGAEYEALYPGDDRPRWQFCLPRLEWGSDELTGIRAALLRRAAAVGHTVDADPDLHLIVDGAAIRPETATTEMYRFAVPAEARDIWLVSRASVPAEIDAYSRDVRRLGVPLERIVLSNADLSVEARHGHAALSDGFHEDEATHRWTNGAAHLPQALLRPFAGAFTIELHLIPSALAYRIGLCNRTAA